MSVSWKFIKVENKSKLIGLYYIAEPLQNILVYGQPYSSLEVQLIDRSPRKYPSRTALSNSVFVKFQATGFRKFHWLILLIIIALTNTYCSRCCLVSLAWLATGLFTKYLFPNSLIFHSFVFSNLKRWFIY